MALLTSVASIFQRLAGVSRGRDGSRLQVKLGACRVKLPEGLP